MTRAVVVRETGGPEVLRLEDWPVGEPGPGEIRVRHTAIGINFIDTYQRSGLYPRPLPFVPGNEGAGVVTAVGDGVGDIRPGDRVAYQSQIGAYAEERLLRADRAVPLPAGISDAVAASAALKGLTAWYLLFRTFPIKPGHTLLWHAAAGGVGLIACQWAKALGARVIGTAGSDDKVELALANGCDAAINYRKEDFAARVRELTDGAGVDVVYDGVGKATFEGSLDSLKPLGTMVSFGNATGVVSIPDLGILARKGSLYLTRPNGDPHFADRANLVRGAEALFDAIARGDIRVLTGRTWSLADAPAAHRALEGRETVGSSLLLP